MLKKISILIACYNSEYDNGIGDAWNKGLKLCRGDIIGILNSDDYYEENIFNDINRSFLKNNKPLIGYGDVILIDDRTKSKKVIKGKIKSRLGLLNGFGFLHPSVFFNKKALKKFDSNLKWLVDVDWFYSMISKDNWIIAKDINIISIVDENTSITNSISKNLDSILLNSKDL